MNNNRYEYLGKNTLVRIPWYELLHEGVSKLRVSPRPSFAGDTQSLMHIQTIFLRWIFAILRDY